MSYFWLWKPHLNIGTASHAVPIVDQTRFNVQGLPVLVTKSYPYTNKCLLKKFLTSSIVSGSEADASHLLFRMKMFGRERRWLTLWKKFFSCRKERDE